MDSDVSLLLFDTEATIGSRLDVVGREMVRFDVRSALQTEPSCIYCFSVRLENDDTSLTISDTSNARSALPCR
jgi:hypothetical protein